MIDLVGDRTLPMLLDQQAERRAGHPAVVFEDAGGTVAQLSYDELAEASRRVAGGFAALGVGRGDTVVVHLANCAEFLLAVLGLARLGAVAVPSNTANGAREMRHVVGFSEARLAVTSAVHLPAFEELAADGGAPALVVTDAPRPGDVPFEQLAGALPLSAEPRLESEAPLEVVFTSGTTALPKGVVLTHANWLWSGERSSRTLLLDGDDRLLSALPLFHVNAQSITLMNALTLGATAVFLEAFSATRFVDQVREHRATHISIVAMILRTLLAQPERPSDRDHALRRVSYAINVPDGEKDAFERRFGVELINGYGLSEAMTEVAVCPVNGPRRWPSIGRPVLDRTVRIVDADGRDVAAGEIGELLVGGVPGRTLFKEYLKDPAATAATLRDGWLHTGDNVYADDEGYLYFFDRAKDIVKRAGENVSASEVESVLLEHPAVAQAAVIGVPDPIRDEAVMAFVAFVPGTTLDETELESYCGERLAAFKIPTVWSFQDGLPVTSVGKVEKKQLRALAAAGGGPG